MFNEPPVHAKLDSNGTVHMAYWDEVNDDVIMLASTAIQTATRLRPHDAMPSVDDRWMNGDGDSYGDNPLGPLPDASPHGCGLVVVHLPRLR